MQQYLEALCRSVSDPHKPSPANQLWSEVFLSREKKHSLSQWHFYKRSLQYCTIDHLLYRSREYILLYVLSLVQTSNHHGFMHNFPFLLYNNLAQKSILTTHGPMPYQAAFMRPFELSLVPRLAICDTNRGFICCMEKVPI